MAARNVSCHMCIQSIVYYSNTNSLAMELSIYHGGWWVYFLVVLCVLCCTPCLPSSRALRSLSLRYRSSSCTAI